MDTSSLIWSQLSASGYTFYLSASSPSESIYFVERPVSESLWPDPIQLVFFVTGSDDTGSFPVGGAGGRLWENSGLIYILYTTGSVE